MGLNSVERCVDDKSMNTAATEWNTPWYLIDRVSRTIRIYHGDLDKTYWKRGTSRGEGQVRRVEEVILYATALQRVTRRHDHQVVEFVLREDLFDRAALALRMSFKCLADDDELLRRMIARRQS